MMEYMINDRERGEVVLTVTIDSVEFLRILSKSGTVEVEQLVCLHVIKNDHKLQLYRGKKYISILFTSYVVK